MSFLARIVASIRGSHKKAESRTKVEQRPGDRLLELVKLRLESRARGRRLTQTPLQSRTTIRLEYTVFPCGPIPQSGRAARPFKALVPGSSPGRPTLLNMRFTYETSFTRASQRDARKRIKAQSIRQLFVNSFSWASRIFGVSRRDPAYSANNFARF